MLDLVDSGRTGSVGRGALAASQIDWYALQAASQPAWLNTARRAFAALDVDGDGVWSCDEILECLHAKLAPSEVSCSNGAAIETCRKRECVVCHSVKQIASM